VTINDDDDDDDSMFDEEEFETVKMNHQDSIKRIYFLDAIRMRRKIRVYVRRRRRFEENRICLL
jgi:hypothetical protein